MKSRDFVFWLQGFFELSEEPQLSAKQVAAIKQHLGLVFAHDPDLGAPVHPAPPPPPLASQIGFTPGIDVQNRLIC